MKPDSQQKQFQDNGVIYLPQLINKRWQQRLIAAIENDIKNPGPHYHGYKIDGGGNFHGNMRLWEHDAEFKDYCFNSQLPALAAKLMNSKQISLFYDQLFVKEPGTNAPTRWHNDQPYWSVRGWDVMSFWVALDPTTIETGALEFVKGSHKWDQWFQPEPFAVGGDEYETNSDYVKMRDIDAERDQLEMLSWDMQPGDVVAFHGLTVHGARGNSSPKLRRRGYTVRYCGDDARYYAGAGTNEDLRNPTLKQGETLFSQQYPKVWPQK
ncbi:MAG: hypothetical protein COA74_02735 [Gammaproteobacteria bacterium]|nr:MAG: hypothetical protein COA74_02735 [Gammaproteobacteria bacterium]